jgi:DNA-binding transcriptional LysR family regulator
VLIDVRLLRYVVLVASHPGFRAAAPTAGVSQTVLSRRIRSLEDGVGVSLFDCSSTGVSLTNASIDFVDSIKGILRELDKAFSVAETAGRGISGRLAIGLCGSVSTGELRTLVVDYLARFPDVAVRLLETFRGPSSAARPRRP